MSNGLALVDAPPRRAEAIQVFDPVPVLDTGRFEQMQRIAAVMARSPLVPDTLRGYHEGQGQSRRLVLHEPEVVLANCFLVVNQAVRWGMDPFAVASCCSVVHGRLMYEGKLVAAVLDAKLNVKLNYLFNEQAGDQFGIRVVGPKGAFGEDRVVDGTVGQWKTTGNNSPWGNPANQRRQLIYRGTREWARLYEPAILLGVYTPDELEGLESETRHVSARGPAGPTIEHSAGPPRRIAAPKPAAPIDSAQAAAGEEDQRPVAERQADAAVDRVGAILADFEQAIAAATSLVDIQECDEHLRHELEGYAVSAEVQARIAEAQQAALKRLAPAPAPQQPAADPDIPVDRKHWAFKRGVEDFKNGTRKPLGDKLKSDPVALAQWRYGQDEAREAAEAAS